MTLDSTTSVGKVNLQAERAKRGIDEPELWYHFVTPQNRYPVDSSDPAKIRTISILTAPTNNSYTSKHARDDGGINDNIVVSLQQVHEGTHKRTYIQQRLQRVKNTNTQYKDLNHTESQMRPSMDKIQMGLRVLKINDGVHNPAHAKPEG